MNEEIKIFEGNIGTLPVYHEQRTCATEILNVFNRHGGPPLLVAQMQQGKTGVCIVVIEQFIKFCESKKKEYEIIYLINISDNVLKAQTQLRLQCSGFSSKVKVIHHSDLKEGGFVPNDNVDVRLIIIDECHIALEQSNNDVLRPFHEFLKKCEVDYGKSIDTWKNKENYILSVSATPYAHIIKTKIDEKAFEPVVLSVSENYYSLQQMKQDGRIHQSESVVKIGKITKFFMERMTEFLNSCKDNGNGHMVVRAIGDAPKIIEKYVKTNYPDVDVRIYESSPINNISSLDTDLNTNFPKPFIAVIRGSLRAGKTLTTTKNIRMWIEPPKSKTDAMCQVVGRCLGFEMMDGKNRKFNDTFPVYCNMKELDLAISFYNGLKCVPSGNWNKATDKVVHDCEIVILEELIAEDVRAKFPGIAISRCSDGKENSYAEIVFKKQLRGYGKNGGKQRVYYMDGSHPNHIDDWNKLIEEMPEVKNRFILMKPLESKIERVFTSKINSDCILEKNNCI
jgi:hypothetical protein